MGLLYVLHNPRLLSMLDDFRHTARLPIQVLHVVRENDARDGAISFKSHEINPALQAADPFVDAWYQKLVRGSAMDGWRNRKSLCRFSLQRATSCRSECAYTRSMIDASRWLLDFHGRGRDGIRPANKWDDA